jgi:hypothetical protein
MDINANAPKLQRKNDIWVYRWEQPSSFIKMAGMLFSNDARFISDELS